MKYLVFDITNMLHRTFFAQRNEDDETIAGLATHSALVTLNKYFKQHKPHKVVMAFDRSSWRKEYTASEECISKKPYKGNRRQDMTPSQEAKYKRFLGHLAEFEQLIIEHTTIMTLVAQKLEADDLIAGFCQVYADDDNEIVIISSDSDLLQLTQYPNVRVISPATDKEQSLEDYDGDPLYYVFQKCVRGDPTDNVQSAFPRVKSTKIREAYDDEYAYANLMNETWGIKDPETGEYTQQYRVGDLFKENQKLIDLAKQPKDIRRIILETVDEASNTHKQFSMFYILKFLGKYKLNKIKEGMDQYIPLLSR